MYVYNVYTYKCIFWIIDFIRIRYTSRIHINIRMLYQIKWKLKKFHQNSQIAVGSFEISVVWLKSFTYNWWCHLMWLASIKRMLFNDTYAYRTVCLRQLTLFTVILLFETPYIAYSFMHFSKLTTKPSTAIIQFFSQFANVSHYHKSISFYNVIKIIFQSGIFPNWIIQFYFHSALHTIRSAICHLSHTSAIA